MVESSKILTVSYGTFSCTLEGFDDSFGTMKAIAEYFRDLAQGDRYFGAEPPAPDAEMLTRIAEKEIARRVEARADESGIVLRATDAEQAPDAAPMMPPVVTPPSEQEVADVASDSTDIEESIQTATADMDGDVAGPEVGEEAAPPLVASSPAAPETAAEIVEDTAAEILEDTSEDIVSDAPATTFADMDATKITEVPAHPDANSVAAKLQRIRAVVSTGTAVPSSDAGDADLMEDAFADDDSAQDVQTPVEEAAETVAEDTVVADEAIEDVATDLIEDDMSEDEADVQADDALATDTVAEMAEDAQSDVQDAADIDAASEDTAELDTSEAVEEDASIAEPAMDVAEEDTPIEEPAMDAAPEEIAVAEDAPKQNFRARILRVSKKPGEQVAQAPADVAAESDEAVGDVAASVRETLAAEMGADVMADADESIFDDIDEDDVAELVQEDVSAEGTLSDEDEAELMADLAEVEREAEVAKVEAPVARNTLPEADDAAMARMMDQTDEALSEPEGSRRRSAIAQLKAAVAATEAARQLGDNGEDQAAKENAFRDDLNEVVRPRAASDLPRTAERTARPRPAPLKLVASQRVEGENADEAAAQPQRMGEDTVAADSASFTDFAAEMGATDLNDLLEAAAAYTAYVEGVEDFSRPQIMKKVQASSTEEFSREDGLRSFGTLLRQGRISKVRNGRFQISEQTRFKPEQKAG